MTDNGNHILDCQIDPIPDAARLEIDICAIPGVVGTGLFLAMADTVLVGDPGDFRIIDERRGGAQAATAARRNPARGQRMNPLEAWKPTDHHGRYAGDVRAVILNRFPDALPRLYLAARAIRLRPTSTGTPGEPDAR